MGYPRTRQNSIQNSRRRPSAGFLAPVGGVGLLLRPKPAFGPPTRLPSGRPNFGFRLPPVETGPLLEGGGEILGEIVGFASGAAELAGVVFGAYQLWKWAISPTKPAYPTWLNNIPSIGYMLSATCGVPVWLLSDAATFPSCLGPFQVNPDSQLGLHAARPGNITFWAWNGARNAINHNYLCDPGDRYTRTVVGGPALSGLIPHAHPRWALHMPGVTRPPAPLVAPIIVPQPLWITPYVQDPEYPNNPRIYEPEQLPTVPEPIYGRPYPDGNFNLVTDTITINAPRPGTQTKPGISRQPPRPGRPKQKVPPPREREKKFSGEGKAGKVIMGLASGLNILGGVNGAINVFYHSLPADVLAAQSAHVSDIRKLQLIYQHAAEINPVDAASRAAKFALRRRVAGMAFNATQRMFERKFGKQIGGALFRISEGVEGVSEHGHQRHARTNVPAHWWRGAHYSGSDRADRSRYRWTGSGYSLRSYDRAAKTFRFVQH